MNIEALTKVTTANGYTPAEVAVAQSKLEKFSSYDKAEALYAAPQSSIAEESEFVPIDRHDSVFYIALALVLNTVIWMTAKRK